MMKQRSLKLGKLLLVFMLLFSFVNVYRLTISGEDTLKKEARNSLTVSYYSCIHWVKDNVIVDIPAQGSDSYLPIGSDLVIHMYVYASQRIDVKTSYENIAGIAFQPYYEGVLLIGNRVASEAEYYQFLKEGLEDSLGTNYYMQYTLHVKSTGELEHQILTNLYVDTGDGNAIKFSNDFKGNFKPLEYYHVVNFYDADQQLVTTADVKHDSAAVAPTMPDKEGYNFLGFNTQMDGTGIYYMGEPILEDMNFYAVYEKQQFSVKYFVNNQLYQTSVVAYGDNAQNIILPDTPTLHFKGWSKDLNNIKANTEVYAIFETIEVPKVDEPLDTNNTAVLVLPETPNTTADPQPEIVIPVEAPKQVTAEITRLGSSVAGSDKVHTTGKRIFTFGEAESVAVDNQTAGEATATKSESSSGGWMSIVPFAVSFGGIAVLVILHFKKRKT